MAFVLWVPASTSDLGLQNVTLSCTDGTLLDLQRRLVPPIRLPYSTKDLSFSTLQNAHVTFATGIPFGPGESVIATLAGGSRGVDVTITGKLVPAPGRSRRAIRLSGGARADDEERGEAPR